MSWPDCFEALDNIEELLTANEPAATEVRSLVGIGAGPSELTACLLRWARPGLREHMGNELRDLPGHAVSTIVQAWMFADQAQQPFRLRPAMPSNPLDMARKRRVEVNVSMDEDGVLVTLAHLAGRHAAWYRPAATV